ncbi:conserved hypothetical protein [Dinoroseobacter shibae DFL 12 = DSM 16493]|uniref:Lipoprotein n=1 Tax=Dinoroseobacter shibae (strain DSM 16493 / NCIMB 14021 / DFL 12) TaxID=398580 RepID=A8LKU8_DINSH|nr:MULTISPECIES: hypothetical protein [Dinoroseobacter]ABV93312.1 conserved hypothetical protein [Dinoroseobacter shibae DFL 12 = DSM 16493]MDD9715597.1 hypothetical protein [Dinoroseobacter sp. PD6]URF48231.1 hypothetical protein M8008_08095 [Dinoroseobacter shibae]URF52541.1 hypothetical protein M8007_08095 [Dinoroseobacter shibae]
MGPATRSALGMGFAALLGLGGCAPMLVYDQPGVTVSRLASDLERCAAVAFDAAPPQITRESVTVRNVSIGAGYGYGYGYRGLYGAGGFDRAWVDVDRNELAREEARQACLREAGYGFAQIPRCQSLSARDVTGATQQAAVGPQSCAVSVPDVGPVVLSGT